jgi:chorismate--pyruvate lyase
LYAVQPPRYHPNEPKWQDYRRYSSTDLPAPTRLWLLDPGSLTQRLVMASGGAFRVVVLSQAWHRPSLSESILLDMPHRQLAIVREVMLMCHDRAVVFARSVIPASSLTGRLRHLRQFDNSSLGELLFRDKSMRRRPFQLTRINGDSEKIPHDLRQKEKLWGRRSRFELAKKPIMVSEIFLTHFQIDK